MNLQYPDLNTIAVDLRKKLDKQNVIVLYAYNGTGKTRLSMTFKDLGKQAVDQTQKGDTLYFNAYTEDLFTWDNDVDGDNAHVLKMNTVSRFFDCLMQVEMDNRIRRLLDRYADFDFKIDAEKANITFSRQDIVRVDEDIKSIRVENIKISRAEENIFIWCFFLAILQLRLDDDEGIGPYKWVKYIYIDDPISSVDEQNAIIVASHLAQLYREGSIKINTIISTHHNLFFNVLHYEFKYTDYKGIQYLFSQDRATGCYMMAEQKGDTPSFHHVAALVELNRIKHSDTIHTYHFNMLRVVLEKTAMFHGYGHFSACIKIDSNDADGILYQRFVDLLSHGKYALFEPHEMQPDTKQYFRKILDIFLDRHQFNPMLFPNETKRELDP